MIEIDLIDSWLLDYRGDAPVWRILNSDCGPWNRLSRRSACASPVRRMAVRRRSAVSRGGAASWERPRTPGSRTRGSGDRFLRWATAATALPVLAPSCLVGLRQGCGVTAIFAGSASVPIDLRGAGVGEGPLGRSALDLHLRGASSANDTRTCQALAPRNGWCQRAESPALASVVLPRENSEVLSTSNSIG